MPVSCLRQLEAVGIAHLRVAESRAGRRPRRSARAPRTCPRRRGTEGRCAPERGSGDRSAGRSTGSLRAPIWNSASPQPSHLVHRPSGTSVRGASWRCLMPVAVALSQDIRASNSGWNREREPALQAPPRHSMISASSPVVTIIPAAQAGQPESPRAIEPLRREIRHPHLERQTRSTPRRPRALEQVIEQRGARRRGAGTRAPPPGCRGARRLRQPRQQ